MSKTTALLTPTPAGAVHLMTVLLMLTSGQSNPSTDAVKGLFSVPTLQHKAKRKHAHYIRGTKANRIKQNQSSPQKTHKHKKKWIPKLVPVMVMTVPTVLMIVGLILSIAGDIGRESCR